MNPPMPNKCPLCRRKYSRSGAYEKHLRNAHGNLDIVLASTVQSCSTAINSENESDIKRHDGHQGPDSDYEFDPAPTGQEYDTFNNIGHESDTDILNEPSSVLPSKPTIYEGPSSSIGEVKCFEQEDSNLCQDTWSPFTSMYGFKLVSWFI